MYLFPPPGNLRKFRKRSEGGVLFSNCTPTEEEGYGLWAWLSWYEKHEMGTAGYHAGMFKTNVWRPHGIVRVCVSERERENASMYLCRPIS